ncbi:PE-PGRS family protein [Tsukamurella ocularis]
MAAAAAVAVAPVATSMGAVTAPSLPPIVQDLGGAASAVANWATAMGLKFVTDPVTGLTKLVQDQLATAGTIAGAAGDAGKAFFGYLEDNLLDNLQKIQADLAAGKVGEAWTTLATTITGSILTPAISLLPVMDTIGGQLGPIGDGLTAALGPLLGLALGPLQAGIEVPALLADGVTAALKALSTGGPAAALTSLFGTASAVNEKAIGALFGEYGAIPSLVNLIPTILGGIAGSDWANAGPFTLPTGNTVTFASASAATLAASPTALPDFGAIGGIWTDTLTRIATNFAGPDGLQRIFSTLLSGVPSGEWSKSYEVIHGILAAPLLELGGAVLQTGDLINPFLGPLGKGLDGAAEPLLYLTLGLYNATRMVPSTAFTGLENVVKALGTGDPVAAINAAVAGLGATLTEGNNALFSDNPFTIGLLPGLLGVGTGFLDGLTGKTPETANATTLADAPAKTAVPASEAADDASGTSGGTVASSSPTVPAEPSEAPVTGTPVAEVPAAETPVAETPAAETPVAETPVVETPVKETPAENPAPEASADEGSTAQEPAASGSSTESSSDSSTADGADSAETAAAA